MDVAPRSPEEIFPLEVWGLILDNLGSVTDFKNCNLTCKAWKKLLLRKRTTFYMPKVFPILYKYLLVDDENEPAHPADARGGKEKLEAIRTRFRRKPTEVLKMRLISTTWKKSVDAYYQNHSTFNGINFAEKNIHEEESEVSYPFVLLPYQFNKNNNSKLESFLEKDFPPDRNPFITRYVNYDENLYCGRGNRLQQQLRNNFGKLLESFGVHIWNCVLTFHYTTSVVEVYQLLRRYLSLMPNLRSLDIFLEVTCMDTVNEVARSIQFEKMLKKEPFPKLEHIVQLHLDTVSHPISVGILAQNEQLRKLSINSYCVEGTLPDPLVELKNLKVEQFVFFSEVEEKDLLQLQKLSWPLKVLHMDLHNRTRWENIFQAISPFRDSLEYFILTLGNRNLEEEQKGSGGSGGLGRLKELRLGLPNLKKFKLDAPICVTTIDFLADCTALQEIELWIDNDHITVEADDLAREGDEDVIQFQSCITSMHKSNVWTILPALQLLKIDTTGVDGSDGTGVFTPKTVPNSRFTRRHHEKYAKSLKGDDDDE